MTSPFRSVYNTELQFLIDSDELTTDRFDNLIPSQKTINVSALLKPASQSTISRWAGKDSNSLLLEGFLVDPLELPIQIQPPCKAKMKIRTATNRQEEGDAELLPLIQNPYVVAVGIKNVTRILVQFRANKLINNEV